MRILTMTVILGLPLMALSQTTEPQQTQGQTNETQTTAPAKGKKMRPAQEQAKPETGTNMPGQTNLSGTNQPKVSVQEFKSRHSEVFSLGRHPKEFFVQRFAASHFRLIGNTYFAL